MLTLRSPKKKIICRLKCSTSCAAAEGRNSEAGNVPFATVRELTDLSGGFKGGAVGAPPPAIGSEFFSKAAFFRVKGI